MATTSIYGVGSSVLVNTAFLSPPFRIEAIGPGELESRFRSDPAYLGRVAHRIEAYDLEFAMVSNSELRLEPFIGSTSLRWAVPVDVNCDGPAVLASLPGVGDKLAARIVAARPFSRIEDLRRVRGIGEKRLRALRPRLRVSTKDPGCGTLDQPHGFH